VFRWELFHRPERSYLPIAAPSRDQMSDCAMSTRKILTAVLWLMGAAATAAGSIAWMLAAEGGMVNAFALVPLMWSVALGAGCVHHLKESGLFQLYRLGSRQSADEPMGALMPQ
jgi:hypothetical protein